MKYIDSRGKAHKKWHKAILADVKNKLTLNAQHELLDTSPDGDRYRVPESYYYEGHPVPPTTPEIQRQANDLDAWKVVKVVVDYEAQEIRAINRDGQVMHSSTIDERLLYSLIKQSMEEGLEHIGLTHDDLKLAEMINEINDANSQAISRVVGAATGRNCILSPSFSDEFIECAAKNINTAIQMYPTQSSLDGENFFKAILSKTEQIINQRLAPQQTPSGESKG